MQTTSPSELLAARIRILGLFVIAIGAIYGVICVVARDSYTVASFARGFAVGALFVLLVFAVTTRLGKLAKTRPAIGGALNGLLIGTIMVIAPILGGIDPVHTQWQKWVVRPIVFALLFAASNVYVDRKMSSLIRSSDPS